MVKLVIFDLDGTLVNAYPAVSRSVNHTLTTLGFKPRTHAQIKRSVGWGDRHLMAQFVGEDLADQAIKLYRPHHTKALQQRGGVRFLAGTLPTLRFLSSKGIKLAIASNRPTRFTKIILKTLGIDVYFHMVLCADKAKAPKPSPDMLWAIEKRLKVKREEILFVGDMTIDVNTGHHAKMRTIAVTTGSSTKKELKDLKPWAIISKIHQLRSIIREGS